MQVPDTVDARAPFDVVIRTYGGGCIDKGDTEVSVEGSGALVTPYDIVVTPPEGFACDDILLFYSHAGTVRFDEPGSARVTVMGRKEPGNVVITVDREVVIR